MNRQPFKNGLSIMATTTTGITADKKMKEDDKWYLKHY
jgi:hypothetical protein